MRRALLAGTALLVVGLIGTLGMLAALVPSWRAAHGGGRTGTFTLTEFAPCDRWEPPRQRCAWYGDFVSDDGSVVRARQRLVGGLAKGAKAGETLPARDVGSPGLIYPLDHTGNWGPYREFLAGFAAMSVAGLVLTRPWRLHAWLRSTKARPER
ncbi:hypothetical protein [Dactylosporangium sp. CS-033363]|uniref:hypothetical protein n=1 Tax=Dactylosporangium sp. CS-033363 TaxID=3239935 RepID=UPI003D903513